jgi:hypothetical protein
MGSGPIAAPDLTNMGAAREGCKPRNAAEIVGLRRNFFAVAGRITV